MKSLHRRAQEARSLKNQLEKHGLTADRQDMEAVFNAISRLVGKNAEDWEALVQLYDTDQRLKVRLYAHGDRWSEAELTA